jgi:folate-binding protein YgfZ
MQITHHPIHLNHLAAFKAYGPDSATFLQSQLTQEILTLSPQAYTLAGYCSAKGRLLANFIIWRTEPDAFMLVCSADLLPALVKRLSMFVLRAKCQFEVLDSSWVLYGIWGDALSAPNAVPILTGQVQTTPHGWLLGLPNAPSHESGEPAIPRQIALIQTKTTDTPLRFPSSHEHLDAWRLWDINSGFPWIVAATADQFVPQMINWEVLSGINFKKGCYPGQEVVARTQYRGTLKRRMFLMEFPVACRAGDEIFTLEEPDQPIGVVVNAAAVVGSQAKNTEVYRALISMKLEAILHPEKTIRIHIEPNTPAFDLAPCLRPLPYSWEEPQDS